ncbi:MAG: hypothetical protein ACI85O_000263 [Saprospiraceae bacterium]|jgi:hypothetical protein
MAGIVLFDDLERVLESNADIPVNFCLESGKILPPVGSTDVALYGHVTSQVISKAEIAAERQRIICMAVTTDGRDYGRPTSWSAMIDALASGAEEEDKKRLFIISAGNVDINDWINYPHANITSSIQDPAQSWNALTIGAYTQKVRITDEALNEYHAIAPAGGLSPFSTTSMLWDRKKWPIKPDIVLEGGNAIINEKGDFTDFCDDLSSLTTYFKPAQRQFDVMRETSGATAKAAHMAAQIQAIYRNAWPETVRGLMVHSAEWTETMKEQFLGGKNKSHYSDLIRVFGYGIPNLERAIASAKKSLNLIVQDTIQPFHQVPSGTGRRIASNEMKLHELPWPKDELLALGETPVEMRITLSYFIEPGPGEIGWKDRYRYASHALRFDVNSSTKDKNEFEKRINVKARAEGESLDNVSDAHRWLIGDTNRHLGSIHSDIWLGTAAEIASCNFVAVYPVTGWWKERDYLKKWDTIARYSLIVSLKTQANEESMDIYTPVAIKLNVPVEVMV